MKLNLQKHVDLFPHTTLRMKGKAENFLMARSREDIIKAKKYSLEHNLPFLILGGGSNVAIIENEIKGIVVKNLYMRTETETETETYVDLKISSGYPVAKLINELCEAGYEGLEYHLGLPGTVGGAIYMNSKWTNPECYFGDPLISANLLTQDGEEKQVNRAYFNFAYDHSTLQETGEILIEAVFRFKKSDPEMLKNRAKNALKYRHETQPIGIFSSGCAFRNITDEEKNRIGENTNSAGNLIDRAGLKGAKIGSFIVSPVHANYIVNEGEGRPEDLKKLLQLVKDKVRDEFGIELKEEVVLI